ncbi:hypothetical protein IJS18_01955 [Candidatus Saccharibacteria bacterium]|nr:hypothetical protein [Candidatus Saccharibacteria bacterium]
MNLNVTCLLVVATVLSGFVLTHKKYETVEAKADTMEIYGDNACTFTASNVTTHTVSINPGSSVTNSMRTRLKTICSDAPSFEIFAIGYSNNSSGNTKLIGQNGGGNISTATSGSSSRWSMKIAKDTSSYSPANMTIENSFGSNHVVPNATTLIATYDTYTDTTTGASVIASYNVSIADGQMADSYIGKVKYSIVAAEPPPLCPAGYICYDGNNDSVIGTMNPGTYSGDTTSKKGYQVATTGSKVALQAPNYLLSGYGFAGWNTKDDGTGTFYGPNQVITVPDVSSAGLMLYAIWVASAGNFQTWQGCSSLTPVSYNSSTGTISASLSNITALTDTRDNQTYAVARLPDDRCWIIENFRFGGTSAAVNDTNTNNPGFDNLSYATSTTPTSWCTTNSQSCVEQLRLNTDNVTQGRTASTYSTTGPVIAYGNYYNRYAATTARGDYYTVAGYDATGDICPFGWHLPDTQGGEWDGIGYLAKQYGGGYGNITNTTIVDRLTSFPNNFVLGGYISGGLTYRGTSGMYESSTSAGNGTSYAYNYYLPSGNVNSRTFRTGISMNSYTGLSVRCSRPAAKQITDLTYMQEFATLSDVDYAGVWNSMEEWRQFQLLDSRDNKSYWITKLGEGNIWMTQNLDLAIARKYYYHADTDIGYEDSSTSWYPSTATINLSSYSGNYFTNWNFSNSNGPISLNPGTASTNWYWDSSKWSNSTTDGYNYLKGVTGNQFATSPYSTNGTHGHVGNYYSWAAAVATNNASQYSHLQNAPNSICPAGWRLPKYDSSLSPDGSSDYTELDRAVQSVWDSWYGTGNTPSSDFDMYLTGAPFYFSRPGMIINYMDPNTYTSSGYGALDGAGDTGSAYWTATSYIMSGYMDTAVFSYYWWGNYIQASPEYNWGRGTGLSVRCLARPQWEIDRT